MFPKHEVSVSGVVVPLTPEAIQKAVKDRIEIEISDPLPYYDNYGDETGLYLFKKAELTHENDKYVEYTFHFVVSHLKPISASTE